MHCYLDFMSSKNLSIRKTSPTFFFSFTTNSHLIIVDIKRNLFTFMRAFSYLLFFLKYPNLEEQFSPSIISQSLLPTKFFLLWYFIWKYICKVLKRCSANEDGEKISNICQLLYIVIIDISSICNIPPLKLKKYKIIYLRMTNSMIQELELAL